jgi:cyclase
MSKPIRLISRLDIKGHNLIKGIHLDGLRVIGNPNEHAIAYYQDGADEIIYIDIVASLYGRNKLSEIVKKTSGNVFIPMTVGGGIRSIEDVEELLLAGADKIAINTAALRNPKLISEVAKIFGSQCMVISIEAKKRSENSWEALAESGREKTDIDVIEWAKKAEDLGAGEILLTSIDQEGTMKGFDVGLTSRVSSSVSIPVITSGGYGKISHLVDAIDAGNADAVAIAGVIHYKKDSLKSIRSNALTEGINLRIL